DDFDWARFFLCGPDVRLPRSTAGSDNSPALGKAVLGVDGVEMVVDHELRAELRSTLLAGFSQEDDITVEYRSRALESQHQHESRDDAVFVVDGSPPVHVPTI